MRDPKVSNVPNESKLQRALMPNSRMFLLFLILFAVITFFFSDRLWLSICEGVIILLLIIYSVIMRARKRHTLERYIESVTYDTESARNNTLQNFPLPMAVFRPADSQVIWANQNFFDLCGRHKPTVDMRITDVIPEFSGRWLLEGNTQCPELLEYQGHKYQIHGNLVRTNPDDAASYMGITYWVDVTDYEKIRLEYYASRPIIAVIVIALRAQRRRRRLVLALQILLLVAFLGWWELSARLGWVDAFIVSSPSRVVHTLVGLQASGELWLHIGTSCLEVVVGFVLGTLLGTLIAIGLWWSELLSRVLDPYLVVLNALPKTALGPVFIVWIGAGTESIIAMTIAISIFVTILNMHVGFLSTCLLYTSPSPRD